MSQTAPAPSSNSPATPPQDWRVLREQERAERRTERRAWRGNSGPWIGGTILIILGIVLFAQNLGLPFTANWWAVFILIPALASFASAWFMFQNNGGQLNSAVRGAILGGLFFTALAAFFLFEINLGIWWPLLLVGAGVILLINALIPN